MPNKKPVVCIICQDATYLNTIRAEVEKLQQTEDFSVISKCISSCTEKYKEYAEANLFLLVALYAGRGLVISEHGESQYGKLFEKKLISKKKTFLILIATRQQLASINKIYDVQPTVKRFHEKSRFFTLEINKCEFTSGNKLMIIQWIKQYIGKSTEKKYDSEKERNVNSDTAARKNPVKPTTTIDESISYIASFGNLPRSEEQNQENCLIMTFLAKQKCASLHSILKDASISERTLKRSVEPNLPQILRRHDFIIIIAETEIIRASGRDMLDFFDVLKHQKELKDKCIFLLSRDGFPYKHQLEDTKVNIIYFSTSDDNNIILDEPEIKKLKSTIERIRLSNTGSFEGRRSTSDSSVNPGSNGSNVNLRHRTSFSSVGPETYRPNVNLKRRASLSSVTPAANRVNQDKSYDSMQRRSTRRTCCLLL